MMRQESKLCASQTIHLPAVALMRAIVTFCPVLRLNCCFLFVSLVPYTDPVVGKSVCESFLTR